MFPMRKASLNNHQARKIIIVHKIDIKLIHKTMLG